MEENTDLRVCSMFLTKAFGTLTTGIVRVSVCSPVYGGIFAAEWSVSVPGPRSLSGLSGSLTRFYMCIGFLESHPVASWCLNSVWMLSPRVWFYTSIILIIIIMMMIVDNNQWAFPFCYVLSFKDTKNEEPSVCMPTILVSLMFTMLLSLTPTMIL